MIDAYLAGGLSAADRERFENYFLSSPYHLRKVEFAGLLRETLAKAARPVAASRVIEEPLWQRIPFAFSGAKHRAVAIALIALVTISGALFYVFWRSRGTAIQSPQTTNVTDRTDPTATDSGAKVNRDAEQQSTDQKRHSAENSRVRDAGRTPERRGTRTVTFALHAVTRGSEEVSSLILHARVSTVRLVIDQPANGYAHYRASLSTVEGEDVWSQNLRMSPPAKAEAKRTLTIPADILSAEDYILIGKGFISAEWRRNRPRHSLHCPAAKLGAKCIGKRGR